MFKNIVCFLMVILSLAESLKICVIGSGSGLGKEIIYQGVNERQVDIIALSSTNKDTMIPCRTNSFSEIKNEERFYHPNIN